MRLLLDENLSGRIRTLMQENGHDATHVADLGLLGAPDEVVLATAEAQDRVLVTADTDFGTLLAATQAAQPSVLLLRRGGRRADQRAEQILAALANARVPLQAGALVVAEHSRLRIRQLPFGRHA